MVSVVVRGGSGITLQSTDSFGFVLVDVAMLVLFFVLQMFVCFAAFHVVLHDVDVDNQIDRTTATMKVLASSMALFVFLVTIAPIRGLRFLSWLFQCCAFASAGLLLSKCLFFNMMGMYGFDNPISRFGVSVCIGFALRMVSKSSFSEMAMFWSILLVTHPCAWKPEEGLMELDVVRLFALSMVALLVSPMFICGTLGITKLLVRSDVRCLVILAIIVGLAPGVAAATCPHCFNSAEGCPQNVNGDGCPLMAGVTANVAAFVAASSVAMSVARTLPRKIQRVFPRSVLDVIHALVRNGATTTNFDPAGKPSLEVLEAVRTGRLGVDPAVAELQNRAMAIADDDEHAAMKMEKLKMMIERLENSRGKGLASMGEDGTMDGVLIYLWAMSDKCVHETEAGVIDFSESKDNEGKAKYQAKLTRPKSSDEFMSRINVWIMTTHATGVANILISTPFLEEVVYSNLRKSIDWKVVHELFVIYLQQVDSSNNTFTLPTVVASGGFDTKMKEAEANAKLCFRGSGGGPRSGGAPSDKPAPYNCPCNPTKRGACFSFNLMQDHPASSIGTDGKCQFVHKCDKWIEGEDGKKVPCGGNHPRVKCNNPKRVDAAGPSGAGGERK